MPTKTHTTSHTLALTLVVVTLIRFGVIGQTQSPLQASIFDSIHTLIFGSSSSSAKSVKTVTTHKAASSSSVTPVAVESSSATSFAPSFTVPVQKWFTVAGYRFPRTIRTGMLGDDVLNLQLILNRNAQTQMAKTGAESPGEETGTFDYKTRISLIAFQKLNLITAEQLTRLRREQGFAGLTTRVALEKAAKDLVAQGKLPSDTTNLHAAAQSAASSLRLLQSSASSRSRASAASDASSAVSTVTSAATSTTSQAASVASTTSHVSSITLSSSSISSRASSVTSVSPGKVIIPGSGFSGPTPQPPAEGSGVGSDERAIARWDVIPYQTFDTSMNVGVVAFHMNDIDHVSFSVNGGPWKDVNSMTLNPETNVVEYWATVRASDVSDGQIELRAIAYPTVGIPRVLQGTVQPNGEQSIWLFANANHTLPTPSLYVSLSGNDTTGDGTSAKPYGTILKALSKIGNGGTVYLKDAGTYTIDAALNRQDKTIAALTNTRFITIKPIDGLNRNQVQIGVTANRASLRLFANRVHWQGVSFDFANINQYYNDATNYVWFDNVRWFSSLGWAADLPGQTSLTRGGSTVYATDSRVEQLRYGFTGLGLVRNVTLDHLSGDALQNSEFIMNADINTMDLVIPLLHMDVLQWWAFHQNGIVYGLTGNNLSGPQGLFFENGSNYIQPVGQPQFLDDAFVNITLNTLQEAGQPPQTGIGSQWQHGLFKNISITRQRLGFGTTAAPNIGDGNAHTQFIAKDVVFENTEFFNTYTPATTPAGVTFRGTNGGTASSASTTPIPSITFTPSTTQIPKGGSIVLTWFASNALSCTASNDWSGTKNLSGSERTATFDTPGPKIFTLSCTGAGGTTTVIITATVLATPASSSSAAGTGIGSDGMTAHFTFDGNTTESIIGIDGTLMNGATYSAGHSGQAISFDGADDYVNVPDTGGTQNIWDGGGAISFWVYPRTCGEANAGFWLTKVKYSIFAGGQTGNTCGLEFDITWSGGVAKWKGGSTTTPVTLNTWNHIVIDYNADDAANNPTLFINNTAYEGGSSAFLRFVAPTGTRTIDAGNVLQIGGNLAASRTTDGLMDDLRFYDHMLSPSEVSVLYQGTVSMNQTPNRFTSFWHSLSANLFFLSK